MSPAYVGRNSEKLGLEGPQCVDKLSTGKSRQGRVSQGAPLGKLWKGSGSRPTSDLMALRRPMRWNSWKLESHKFSSVYGRTL